MLDIKLRSSAITSHGRSDCGRTNRLEEPPKHLFLREHEKQPLFARALPPTLEDKKQTDDQNQNILPESSFKSMPFSPEPRSINKCHFLSRSAML